MVMKQTAAPDLRPKLYEAILRPPLAPASLKQQHLGAPGLSKSPLMSAVPFRVQYEDAFNFDFGHNLYRTPRGRKASWNSTSAMRRHRSADAPIF